MFHRSPAHRLASLGPRLVRPLARGGGRGELYAHIDVEIPTKLSKEESQLLENFANLRGEKSRASQVKKSSDSGLFSKFKDAFRN